MYLTFTSKNHKTVHFTKSLIKSEFITREAIPKQVLKVYANREKGGGVERDTAYAGEINYFKQGAYNQANAKSTKSETYNGDIAKQYANGSYAEVWFKKATLGASTAPHK
ncbi:alginate lyase [Winogradskyella sp. PG-2]|nr:alginate lyase [Winogradskyella sp. PG-2]